MKTESKLTRRHLAALKTAIIEAEAWRGSMVGNPDPLPLARFDRMIADAKEALSIIRRKCQMTQPTPAPVAQTTPDIRCIWPSCGCKPLREECLMKSSDAPAPVAPKVVLGLGDAIELTKSYRDEFAETGETLLSNGQARRFADALTLVLYAVNGEK